MSNAMIAPRGRHAGELYNYAKLPEIAQKFLDTHANSSQTVSSYASILAEFFGFVGKDPLDVTIHDWDAYVNHFNAKINKQTGKPISTSGFKTAHAAIISFYKFAQPRYMREGRPFIIPIPSFKHAGFMPRPGSSRKNRGDRLLSREDMKKVLTAARAHGYDRFIAWAIKKHTGMRLGEDITIKIEDVHLEDRWIGTCLEDGARKSNKDGEDPLPFFIPQFLADELRLYILQLHYKYPGNPWLFPGRNGQHLHVKTLEAELRRISKQTGVIVKSHWFRHSLNTYRKYEKKCPREIRKQLINHKTSEAIDVYDEGSMKMRRDDYDIYHPYTEI